MAEREQILANFQVHYLCLALNTTYNPYLKHKINDIVTVRTGYVHKKLLDYS